MRKTFYLAIAVMLGLCLGLPYIDRLVTKEELTTKHAEHAISISGGIYSGHSQGY